MDSKIKSFTIWSFTICSFILSLSLTGCKQNKWLDWKAQNEMWLEQNKNKPGVQVTSSGLQYKIIADPGAKNGEARPNQTSTVICDYEAKLINGCVVNPAMGARIILSQTIPGFAEGCHKIHSHGDIELYIPAYLGYDSDKYNNDKYNEAEGLGTEGTTSFIPPYSTLIYTVHLCSVVGE